MRRRCRRTAGYRDRRVLAPHRRVGHRRLRHGAGHTVGAAARRILKRGGTRLIRDSAWLGGRALAGEQGLWGIFEVFADTIVICTATALTILCSGVGIHGAARPGRSCCSRLGRPASPPRPPRASWRCRCCCSRSRRYSAGRCTGRSASGFYGVKKAAAPYRLCFSLAITVGCLVSLRTVWAAADLLNGLMAIPNFIGALRLVRQGGGIF